MNKLIFVFFFLCACAHREKLPSYDAELSGFIYPHEVKTYNLKTDLKMRYMFEKSNSPNGKTVLLLHGKNFGAWYWGPVMKELLNKGFNVIAPDQIGFGKSSKPEAYQYSFHALSSNTKMLLDDVGIKEVIVVGHSMGGMLATRFSLMYPETASKLILINPIGLEDWKIVAPYRSVDELYRSELSTTPDKIREYQKVSYYDGIWKPEYENLIEAAKGQTRHKDYPLVAWNSALTSDMIYTQPVVYEFPLLKQKTLLIIGTRDRTAIGKDRVAPEIKAKMGQYQNLGKNTARAIPKSKLVELPGVGHMPMIEAFPEMMKALNDFITKD